MRFSEAFIPTLREIPSEAQIPSHQLMLRAGMIRQVAAGVYSFLPLGYRVVKKVMEILREEMDRIGGQEFHLPALNPIEIWEATDRVAAMGDVLFRIENRRNLVLAPTHEEIITYHAKQHIKSYKDLPQIWYQIQTKFRNEPRPRSGVLRGRQFLMKDSYSLDASWEGLDQSYQKHYDAYCRIFSRAGLQFFVVGASSGAMGGSASQEFMVESPYGEDTCALCDHCGYAANLEVATSSVSPVPRIEPSPPLEIFPTPNAKTIDDLVEQFQLPERRCAKSVVYIVDSQPVLILMRGNDELNEEKLATALQATHLRPAEPEEILDIFGAHPGSIGPIGAPNHLRILADQLLQGTNGLISGANKDGYHYKNIDLQRDVEKIEYFDLRTVQEGEPCPHCRHPLRIVRAIEIGHIFKLGTKYSEALGATILLEDGTEQPIIMGSYGIGVERIIACYIEQNHDDKGIIWNPALTPYDLSLIGINVHKDPAVQKMAEDLYGQLQQAGFSVLFDDRPVSAGIKFNDADLLGFPLQILLGPRSVQTQTIELKIRRTGERRTVPLAEAVAAVQDTYQQLAQSSGNDGTTV